MPFVPHSPPFAEQIRPKLLPAEFDRTQVALQEVTAAVEGGALAVNRPVNLYDLGADPTGSVSVSSILSAASGRQVDIPPGTYKVGSQISIPANTIWNAERGVTFLVASGFPSSTAAVLSTQPNVRILGDLTIDANNIGQFCLQTEGNNFRSNGLTVRNSLHHGIYAHQGDDVTFENLRAITCGSVGQITSVGLYGSANRLRVDGAHLEGNAHQGMYLSGNLVSTICQISNVSAINNGSTGVDVRIPGSVVTNITATGNVGGGFTLNLQSVATRSADTVLTNINCYKNVDSATNHSEINISSQDRVVATGLSAYSDSCQYGLRLNDVSDLLVVGAQIIGGHSGYQSAVLVPALASLGCSGVEIYASRFRNYAGTTTPVFNLSGVIDGFKVSGSSIGGSSRGVRYIGPNSISNTDFRGNTWTAALANRFQELSAPTGTNRLPVAAPTAFTSLTEDPSNPGLWFPINAPTTGNVILTDLIAAGWYM